MSTSEQGYPRSGATVNGDGPAGPPDGSPFDPPAKNGSVNGSTSANTARPASAQAPSGPAGQGSTPPTRPAGGAPSSGPAQGPAQGPGRAPNAGPANGSVPSAGSANNAPNGVSSNGASPNAPASNGAGPHGQSGNGARPGVPASISSQLSGGFAGPPGPQRPAAGGPSTQQMPPVAPRSYPPAAPGPGGAFAPTAVQGQAGTMVAPGQAPRPAVPTAAQPVPAPAQQPRPAGQVQRASGPRKVRLNVAKVDPFSVLKLSFLVSVGIGVATVVSAIVVWQVLNGMGVFSEINRLASEIGGPTSTFDVNNYVGMGKVVSLATVIAVVNVALLTALSTLGAFLYNLSSGLVGGLHVTLSDD